MAIKDTGLTLAGIRGDFFERLANIQTTYDKLVTPLSSNTAVETYRWLGSVPSMREFVHGRQARGLRSETYSIRNLEYEATIEIDGTEFEDDQLGQINLKMQELPEACATHPDYLLSQLLINGDQAGFHSYDGVPFFSNAHESGASGAQNNIVTHEIAGSTPTAQEYLDAVNAAKARMLAFKDDVGRPRFTQPPQLKLLNPPDLDAVSRVAMNATMIGSTSNVFTGIAEPMPFAWLSSPLECYLFNVASSVRGIVHQTRRALGVKMLGFESDYYVLNGKILVSADCRYRMTYGYWQNVVKIVFQTGG